MTDIVDSSLLAAHHGAEGWRLLQRRHDALVRRCLERMGGTEHATAGDSLFATFDGAADAVRFGLRAHAEVADLGMQLRIGVHVGEVGELNGQPHGMSLHVAARVQAAAPPGAVVATAGVRDALVGAGDLAWTPLGIHQLKGVPGEWPLWRAEAGG